MSKKLYVGNLSYGTTNEVLNQMFSEFGVVKSAEVIMDNFSGRSKGFGFVEMENDQEAALAIEKLDGKEVDGRTIKVNEARPKTDRDRGPDRGQGRSRRSW